MATNWQTGTLARLLETVPHLIDPSSADFKSVRNGRRALPTLRDNPSEARLYFCRMRERCGKLLRDFTNTGGCLAMLPRQATVDLLGR